MSSGKLVVAGGEYLWRSHDFSIEPTGSTPPAIRLWQQQAEQALREGAAMPFVSAGYSITYLGDAIQQVFPNMGDPVFYTQAESSGIDLTTSVAALPVPGWDSVTTVAFTTPRPATPQAWHLQAAEAFREGQPLPLPPLGYELVHEAQEDQMLRDVPCEGCYKATWQFVLRPVKS